MQRLTIKNKKQNQYYPFTTNGVSKKDVYNKLGQLEDLEEKLGIGLIKLFEIYKKLVDLKSLWFKGEVSGYEYIDMPKYNQVVIDFEEMTLLILDYGEVVFSFHFKYYGKTWALTKEELESE